MNTFLSLLGLLAFLLALGLAIQIIVLVGYLIAKRISERDQGTASSEAAHSGHAHAG